MRPLHNYTLEREWRPGDYGESLVLVTPSIPRTFISAGLSDDVTVYHDKECVYVVSENGRFGCIGLQVLEKGTGDELAEVSMRESDEPEKYLGMHRYPTKIRALLEYTDL